MTDIKNVKNISEEEENPRVRCPEERANFLSRLFLTWVFSFVLKGWKKPLVDEDLWELRDHERGSYTTDRLLLAFNAQTGIDKNKASMTSALIQNYRKEFIGTGILKGITVGLNLVNVIFLNNLIKFAKSRGSANPPPISVGLGWAFSLLVSPLFFTIIENHYFLRTFRTGMCVRSAMQGVLYDKSLRMSPSARAGSSVGEIVNLMQMDSQRVGDFAQIAHILWSAPIQLVVSVALLFNYIQWSAAIGLLATLLTLPLQGKLMAVQMRLRKESVGITDVRVKLMNEILQGIKAVKFYAWEKPFSDQVEKERKAEVENFSKTIWARSLFFSIMLSIPILIAVVTFAFYAGVFKKSLEPDKIFTGITLLNILRQPVLMLPFTVTAFIDARIGLKRIDRFLRLEDTDDYARKGEGDSESRSDSIHDSDESDSNENDKEMKVEVQKSGSGRGEIIIENASFRWGEPGSPITDPATAKKKRFNLNCFKRKSENDNSNSSDDEAEVDDEEDKILKSNSNILQNISLQLSSGQLTAVLGRVGAGKSSLVAAILGEMQKTSGHVSLRGEVAYVAQTAWIFNDTLRNNILFGKKFNEKLYQRAVRVSALGPDIEVLPAGDQTAIGEKGINLSGGQKQRVSIARAVYADADVYIFDDPLSALDAHVSQTVFDKCISNKGVLRNRLRLLITNQVQVLPACNHIVLLEKGSLRNQGTYKELSSSDSVFQEIINEKKVDKEGEEVNSDAKQEPSGADPSEAPIETISISVSPDDKREAAKRDAEKAGNKLIQDEDRNVGNIVVRAYYQYAKACGGLVVFSLCVIFWGLVVALGLSNPIWLAIWSDNQQLAKKSGVPDSRGLGFYIGIYVSLGIGYAVTTTFRSVWYLNMALYAGKRLHQDALASVLHAPMYFFDTTPIGRILSRFSRDVAGVDQLLPQAFSQMLTTVLSLIGTYIIIAYNLPPFLGIAAPVTFGYWLLQRFFNRTSLEVKRLDSISKTPIYAHFSETLSGLSTIRAYNKQESAKLQNRNMIDINHRAYFAYIVASRWFSIYLELMGSLLIFAAALFAVIVPGRTSAAGIGLSLSYALQVTSILGFSVRSITELEAQMNSVERLNHYAKNLPQEAATVVDPKDIPESDRPLDNWPTDGAMEIKDVELRYREGLELVLKGVSVNIEGGEKVGVIGRTGSGKSTMMVALLRLVELTGGSINVDGVNLANLGLDQIRKSITIIPQDPVLFSGTVRFNLDPFGIYSEPLLWDALEKSHLKEFVKDFDGGLDARVSEYGENLSAGQRQLICLTRALLRNSKILILDEASSSLDMETDRLIQGTIRKHLKEATILTIAHRLFTLADYDKILVMDNGSVAEYDSPAELLSDSNSKFSGFVNSLGPSGAEQFKRMVENKKQV